jgi:hypothetical protein
LLALTLDTLLSHLLRIQPRHRQVHQADRLPECYSEELCEQKRDDVYQHVYANYWGAGQSVYAVA